MKSRIKELAQELSQKLVDYRRDFHRHPEAGWTEFRTTSIIALTLQKLGYEIKIGKDIISKESMLGVPTVGELETHMGRAIAQGANEDLVRQMEGGLTGVVADMVCGDGPLLILRFDIDANDLSEATEDKHRPARKNFSSINPGVMHACGHDGHIALGLGVAELLVTLKNKIRGTVRLVFQPAEEGVQGAAPMVDAGILEGVDFILGGHIGYLARKNGQFVCGTEKFLATTKFDVTFTGLPAHAGGLPEEGSNALLAASCATLNLHAITRHSKGLSRINVGVMTAGQGRNVIPPNALIKVETRGETSDIDAFMFDKARNVIAGAAQMYGVQHEIILMGTTKSGKSSQEMIDRVKKVALGIDYFKNEEIIDIVSMGASEDFSHMMTRVQECGGLGTYFSIGTDLAAGHHDFYFDFDESCLVPGVEFITTMTLDLLA
ncbi:MAG: amidohydrolase [Desulfotalea sp.]